MEIDAMQQDIKYIREMIEQNRRQLVHNGLIYIFSGIYVVVGLILTYVLSALNLFQWMPYMWLALLIVLVIVNMFVPGRVKPEKVSKTFGTSLFEATWLSAGIPLMIFAVIFFLTRRIPFDMMVASCSSILGIAYYLTGKINNLPFMTWISFGWWAGAILAIFWTAFWPIYHLGLFFSFLVLFFEVVPGIIIYKKWKKVYHG